MAISYIKHRKHSMDSPARFLGEGATEGHGGRGGTGPNRTKSADSSETSADPADLSETRSPTKSGRVRVPRFGHNEVGNVQIPWASAHRSKWGQLTLEKWMKNYYKDGNVQKEQLSMFMLYCESNQGRQV